MYCLRQLWKHWRRDGSCAVCRSLSSPPNVFDLHASNTWMEILKIFRNPENVRNILPLEGLLAMHRRCCRLFFWSGVPIRRAKSQPLLLVTWFQGPNSWAAGVKIRLVVGSWRCYAPVTLFTGSFWPWWRALSSSAVCKRCLAGESYLIPAMVHHSKLICKNHIVVDRNQLNGKAAVRWSHRCCGLYL